MRVGLGGVAGMLVGALPLLLSSPELSSPELALVSPASAIFGEMARSP